MDRGIPHFILNSFIMNKDVMSLSVLKSAVCLYSSRTLIPCPSTRSADALDLSCPESFGCPETKMKMIFHFVEFHIDMSHSLCIEPA